MDDLDGPTPEEIERARLIGLFERSEFERESGCTVDADGRIELPEAEQESE